MGTAIPYRKRLAIIKAFLRGLPFDNIADEEDVAKGTVVNVIDELRSGQYPSVAAGEEVDMLREISVAIRKRRVSLSTALVGLALVERLFELGIDPAHMDRCVKMWSALLTVNDVDRERFAEVALHLHSLQLKRGQDYDSLREYVEALVAKSTTLGSEVRHLTQERATLAKTIQAQRTALAKREEDKARLQYEVGRLGAQSHQMRESLQVAEEALRGLREEVKRLRSEQRQLGSGIASLTATIKRNQEILAALEDIGLSERELRCLKASLEELAAKSGLDRSTLADRLMSGVPDLRAVVTLEAQKAQRTAELDRLTKQIDEARKTKALLNGEISALAYEKRELDQCVATIRDGFLRDIRELTASLRNELTAVVENMKEQVRGVGSEVDGVVQRAFQVGEKVEVLEATTQTLRWIRPLKGFLETPDSLSFEEARPLLLAILTALDSWLQANALKLPIAFATLRMSLRGPISVLEGRQP